MVLRFEAAFLLLPSIVALIYMEKAGLYYLLTAVLCFGIGTLLQLVRSDKGAFYTKEGFVGVALSWIVLSAFGALPFVLCGDIPSYTDALFETISGFTTTGASILNDVGALNHCSLFWRSFTLPTGSAAWASSSSSWPSCP